MITYWPMLGRILRAMIIPRYIGWRFWLFQLILIPAILGFRLFVMLFQGLDYVLFPGFMRQDVQQPIFIISNPRSGSTFLHRLLEKDPQFTYLKLWHTLLPSITLYRVVHAIALIERPLGRPLYRAVHLINRLAFGGWDGIHAAGLDKSEEDELLFVYLFLTPGVMIFFPFMHRLEGIANIDALPPKTRTKIAHYYRRCVQRHVYASGGKTFLAKNALAAGRLGIYRQAFPDLRVVHLYRDPAETVPSTLSMFTRPWRFHSPNLVGATPESHWIKDLVLGYYALMSAHQRRLAAAQYQDLDYANLIAEPRACVERVYADFGLAMCERFREQLAADCERAKQYRSAHEYDLTQWGLSETEIRASVPAAFHHYSF